MDEITFVGTDEPRRYHYLLNKKSRSMRFVCINGAIPGLKQILKSVYINFIHSTPLKQRHINVDATS